MEALRIGIVGAGHMGRIRAQSAQAHPGCRVVQVADTVSESAEALAKEVGCEAGTDWQHLVARRDIDAVVVATPHKYLAPITIAALQAGKHVFCEKPMARTVAEADEVLTCHRSHPQVLVVGFTLRHHPAIARARELLLEGAIGEPFYVRGCYGHGGRPGYQQEWRADPELAGGGELLDQGIHLIDLSRWFLGEFREVSGLTATFFWGMRASTETTSATGWPSPVRRPVEDNAFVLLRTRDGRVASLHASWTQWKNRFSFEVFGRDGFLVVDGLGGSYGLERLTKGRRRAEGGPPELEEFAFGGSEQGAAVLGSRQVQDRGVSVGGCSPSVDEVWRREWTEFMATILTREPFTRDVGHPAPAISATACAGGIDARQAVRVVQELYGAPAPALTELSD